MSATVNPLRQQLANARERRPNGFRHLPADCPVLPLGGDGRVFYYLNAIGQIMAIEAQQHSKNVLSALFAPRTDWCIKHFPKTFDKETGEPTDFKNDVLMRALVNEAQERGRAWEPSNNVHGRGVWRGEDGDLRLHLGSHLVVGGQRRAPGMVGERVYPLRPEWKGPAPDAQAAGPAGPAAELLALLDHWHWAVPGLAPRLVLGWVMASWLCGALDWRPHLWLIAPRGSGKSTLLDMLGHLLQRGDYLLAAEDASAAALRAKLGYDARPVCLDETEPSEDNRGLNNTVKLLRQSSSGGTALRATVDQAVIEQTLRFTAICASVVKPSLASQDQSRITVLQMLKPPRGSAPPLLRREALELLGRRLLRRAIDGWPRWEETRHIWREALMARGCDPRNGDQYSVLLGLAWIAEQDEPPDSDSLDIWAQMTVDATQADRAEERPEWFRLIEMLAATVLRDEGGRAETSVAELLEVASFARRRPDPETGGWTMPTAAEAERAQSVLRRHGIAFEPVCDEQGRPLRRRWAEPDGPAHANNDGPMLGHVAVANSHPLLAKLFERTHWAARPGAPGAWKGVLEQAPGAVLAGAARFGPRTSRAVKVPLHLFFDGVGHDGE
ncbi:hypothetical protein [Rubritepida flocculans]|uniref:hypothetical protein n=1 Tax=Rubritepida flocculans TaxID=182403 RepID=UPI00040C90E1|nr:hypothetical protein [Rubritepida flocculans]